jgi:hypothetical protein
LPGVFLALQIFGDFGVQGRLQQEFGPPADNRF